MPACFLASEFIQIRRAEHKGCAYLTGLNNQLAILHWSVYLRMLSLFV